jgi:hypothetical protein
MTVLRHELAFSRRVSASELCRWTAPFKQRARGMPGAGRTHGPPAKKMLAAGTTGSAETSRHSPRDGFNGCFAFSLVRRACWPPWRMMLSHQRGYQRRGIRTTRLDRAHLCRSSAWINHAATSTRPPHPASTSVTTAKRPSCEAGRRELIMDSGKAKDGYFSPEGWTGVICLNRPAK